MEYPAHNPGFSLGVNPDCLETATTGVYIDSRHGSNPRFRRVKGPTSDELNKLTHTIAHRVGRYLERRGLLEGDADNTYLTQEAVVVSDEDPAVIRTILAHLDKNGVMAADSLLLDCRASPGPSMDLLI